MLKQDLRIQVMLVSEHIHKKPSLSINNRLISAQRDSAQLGSTWFHMASQNIGLDYRNEYHLGFNVTFSQGAVV